MLEQLIADNDLDAGYDPVLLVFPEFDGRFRGVQAPARTDLLVCLACAYN